MLFSAFFRAGSYSSCLIVLLTGCGGSSDSSPSPSNPTPPVSYSMNLAWKAPISRMDGSSLSLNDVAGYKIYMGKSESNLDLVKTIEDPQTLSTEITDLSQGKYYFAIATYDSENLVSPLSNTLIREF